MYTLTTYFGELLKNIEPSLERLEAAQQIPDTVREYLKNSENFRTLPPHSALAGSYRRHTAVGDIKDVDIIVRVDAGLDESPSSIISNLKKALEKLPASLELPGYTEVSQSRRSVHVYFEGKDFHLDVVPAIVPKEIDQKLFIPDKMWGKWIPSNPLGYCRYLSELNGKHGSKIVPLIKLVKYFRDYQMKIRKPKSYWIEALVVYHTVNGSVDANKSLAEMFQNLMSAIYSKFAPLLGRNDMAIPHIPDPMLGNDISWNWERSHFETFMRRVKEASDLAKEALQTEELEQAINSWQKVFGEDMFPGEVKQAAKILSEAVPGAAYVSSAGVVSAVRPTTAGHIITQPTKFYGEE